MCTVAPGAREDTPKTRGGARRRARTACGKDGAACRAAGTDESARSRTATGPQQVRLSLVHLEFILIKTVLAQNISISLNKRLSSVYQKASLFQ